MMVLSARNADTPPGVKKQAIIIIAINVTT
jgi:hypothetical protein